MMARACTRGRGGFTATAFGCVEAMRYDDSQMDEVIKIGIRTLEVLFFGGLIGSAILVLIAAVEDVETVFSSDEADSSNMMETQD